MAEQSLKTVIVLSGRVDNQFGQLGEGLTVLGSQVDQISRKIIDFGTQSVETYMTYDDAMRETQAVGEYTAAEMAKLDEFARAIAKDKKSIYDNIDAANAMVLVAQAGLEVTEIYDVLPSTMDLAMAGNLGMADAVNYLLSSLASLNYEMSYADELTDQMAKTASIGMTDIDTLGESLMRLGSASQMFTGGSVEIFAILSAMGKFGEDQRGSEAGTWMRNFILSLAAPAGSLQDTLDAMEQLGLSQEEIDEYAEKHSSGVAAAAVEELVAAGLTIYDEQGKLLPAIEIIKSLRDTVRGSGQYAEDWTELTDALAASGGNIDAFTASAEGLTDNALYNLFRQIFDKKGIVTALNLISISDEEWDQTVDAILNSEGFAESMAETMQGGIGGAIRSLEAAYTEFQTTIGEALAPTVQAVADGLNGIVVSLSEMDPAVLEGLLGGATALAAAGPGLLLVGGSFRLLGALFTPAGKVVAAVSGITAIASALYAIVSASQSIKEADLKASFGTMGLDFDALGSHVSGLTAEFNAAYQEVNAFDELVAQAVSGYEAVSQTLSSDLLTAMVTGATLTKEDQKSIAVLGDTMHKELISAIQNSTAGSMSYWEMLFGGEGVAEGSEDYRSIIDTTDAAYQQAMADAEQIGKDFRGALTEAFADGQISEDEYENIHKYMQSYNDAMAKAAADAQKEEDYIAMQMLLHKAQSASYDDVVSMAKEIEEERARVLEAAEQEYLEEYFKLQYRGADASVLENTYDEYKQHVQELTAKYDAILLPLFEGLIGQGDNAKAWNLLNDVLSDMDGMARDPSGALTLEEVDWAALDRAGLLTDDIGNQLITLHEQADEFEKMLEPFASNPQIAEWLEQMGYLYALGSDAMSYQMRKESYEASGGLIDPYNEFSTEEVLALRVHRAELEAELEELYAEQEQNDTEFEAAQRRLDGYDRPLFYGLTGGESNDWNMLYGNVAGGNLTEKKEKYSIDIAAAESALAGIDAQLKALGADTLFMNMEIAAPESAADEAYKAAQTVLDGMTLTVDLQVNSPSLPGFAGRKLPGFAEGGRATSPSIFGEAGAEWAIPEAHTPQTASLLRAAAAASGFTWPELVTESSTPRASSRTLVYSPTIIAYDANGVDAKLKEDKERLERWYQERQMREEIEVYE